MSGAAVTVLMPVYNAEPHLQEAIESVLAQTFPHFEFVIVDDGSTDASGEILSRQTDPRIRIIHHPSNRGIVAALNAGLAQCETPYIARMDADDVAVRHRLERQWNFLEANPEVGLCGSGIDTFGESSGPNWVKFSDHDNLRVALLFGSPFCHPTVVFRRAVLDENRLAYPSDYPHAEEFALWVQLSDRTRLANLDDVLLKYRTHAGQVSRRRSREQCASIDRIVTQQLQRLGLASTKRELAIHHLLGESFFPLPGLESHLASWVDQLLEANQRSEVYTADTLLRQLRARQAQAVQRVGEMLRRMPPIRRWRWQAVAMLQHYRCVPRY